MSPQYLSNLHFLFFFLNSMVVVEVKSHIHDGTLLTRSIAVSSFPGVCRLFISSRMRKAQSED